MTNFIVSNREWHRKYIREISERTGTEIIYIDNKDDLTLEILKQHRPRYVFFPHWSYIIPAEIYENYECVVFHMTDLPFGRGGSPLQNLISRGIYETKISALRCVCGLDAGDIYMKRDLSLYGSAEEIYIRAAEATKEMMIRIIQETPVPQAQSGEVVSFKRRRPEESDIGTLCELNRIFDYIRMLDADGHRDELAHLHENSERAARCLGAEGVRLCSFPDNRMDSVDLLDVVKEVEREIDSFKPSIVYTHHGGDVNIDHRITHDAVVTACRPLLECSVEMLLLFEVASSTEWQIPSPNRVFAPNWFVDIEREIDGKLDALHYYTSEMREYPHSRSYQSIKNLAAYRGTCEGRKYAEAFSLGRSIL